MDIQSEMINELAKALAVAQGSISAAQKDGTNPHFKSTYATLDSIWQACRKPLADNGLSVVQLPMSDDAGLYLITTLLHQSGQWMRSSLRIKPVADTPQAVGSALTYGRRYALAAIVGVAPADEDDDGEGATMRQQPQRAVQQRPPEQPKNGPPIMNVRPETAAALAAPAEKGQQTTVPTSPQDLMNLINSRVQVPYDNVPHLFNAIRNELDARWNWPDASDVDGWRAAYKAAKAHADKKVQQPVTE